MSAGPQRLPGASQAPLAAVLPARVGLVWFGLTALSGVSQPPSFEHSEWEQPLSSGALSSFPSQAELPGAAVLPQGSRCPETKAGAEEVECEQPAKDTIQLLLVISSLFATLLNASDPYKELFPAFELHRGGFFLLCFGRLWCEGAGLSAAWFLFSLRARGRWVCELAL